MLLERPNSRYVEVKVRDPDVVKELAVGADVEVAYTGARVVDVVAQKT